MNIDDQSGTPGAVGPRAGWYADPANPGHERLWTGERWIAWIRPFKGERAEANPVGWRLDPTRPGFERLWTGEMWTEEIRRADTVGPPAATAATPPPPGPGIASLPPAPRPTAGAIYHDPSPPDKLWAPGIMAGAALAGLLVVTIVEFVAAWRYIGVLGDVINRRPVSYAHVESVTHLLRIMQRVSFLVTVVAGILFVIWFYRAYRNLARAGIRDLRFDPGWALGGWFIPIFSFFRQKQIANDIWKASASAGTVGSGRRAEIGLPATLNWWWGLWICSGVFTLLGDPAISEAHVDQIFSSENLRGERAGMWFVQIGLVTSIAALVLVIHLIRRISRMQDRGFPITAESTAFAEAVKIVPGAAATSPGTKICPDCAEEVKAAANVCRYCGHRFGARPEMGDGQPSTTQ